MTIPLCQKYIINHCLLQGINKHYSMSSSPDDWIYSNLTSLRFAAWDWKHLVSLECVFNCLAGYQDMTIADHLLLTSLAADKEKDQFQCSWIANKTVNIWPHFCLLDWDMQITCTQHACLCLSVNRLPRMGKLITYHVCEHKADDVSVAHTKWNGK